MSGRESVRAFFAVELSSAARAQAAAAIELLRSELPDPVRWVPEENLHLTLKFLGELDPDRIPKLVHLAAAKLVREHPFEAEIGGLGGFPSARAARVVWLGVTHGAGPLARLARKLDASAGRLGLERERRPYRAHLTIGRLPTPERIPFERVEAPGGARFPVDEVVLFESRPSSAGSRYRPLARLPLGRADALELAPLD